MRQDDGIPFRTRPVLRSRAVVVAKARALPVPRRPAALSGLSALAALLLAGMIWAALAGGARADAMVGNDAMLGDDAVPTMRGPSRTIETWPSLDHHVRNDMVEPGWRHVPPAYGYDTGPYARGPRAEGAYGPADARLRRAERIPSSLDKADRGWRCDPWRDACRPAQPWWTNPGAPPPAW